MGADAAEQPGGRVGARALAAHDMKSLKWVMIVAAMTIVVLLGWRLLELSTSRDSSLYSERITGARRSATSPPAEVLRAEVAPKVASATGAVAHEVVRPRDAGLWAADQRDSEALPLDGGRALLELKEWFAKNAEQAARHVDRFCELSQKVAKLKAFARPPPTGTRDAALYLASRVDWEGGTIGSLHLSRSLTDRMTSPPLHWLEMGPADYAGLDFGWLSDLLGYDTWSMSATGPLRDLKDTTFIEAPIPNFVSLQHWAKLRLLKGAKEGELEQASVEVRHLADLCAATGILIGEMIRAAMYGIERTFYEHMGLPKPSRLPSADETQAYRRTTYAGMYFLMPGVSKAVRERAIACSAARCPAINEALGVSAAARDALPEARESLDWLLAQSPCDAVLAERIANSPSATDEALQQQFEGATDLDSLLGYDAGMP